MAHAPQTPVVRAFRSANPLLANPVHPAGSSSNPARPESAATGALSFFQAAVQETAQLVASDSGLIAIAIDSDEVANGWAGPADRLFNAAGEPEAALAWCTQLIATGTHPLVFAPAEIVREHLASFRRHLASHQTPMTLLVRAATAPSEKDVEDWDCDVLRRAHCDHVLCPSSLAELSEMLRRCVGDRKNSAIWLPHWPIAASASPPAIIESGHGQLLLSGREVGIIALGPSARVALDAAAELSVQGIPTGVLNARFSHPMDERTITRLAAETGSLAILQTDYDRCGFVRRVLETLAKRTTSSRVHVIDLTEDCPVELRDVHEHHVQKVVAHCQSMVAGEHAGFATSHDFAVDAAHELSGSSSAADWLAGALEEHRQVLDYEPSPTIAEWIDRYEEVGKRGVYLWKWCLHGLELIALPCIAPALRDHLRDTKLLAVMLGVMLDDVADQAVDDDFLKELTKLTFNVPIDIARFTQAQQEYARFTSKLWDTINQRLAHYPRFREYETLLAYDHQQIINAMSYSCLLNRDLCLVNMVEHDAYLPHNMQMMSFATMDLMCSTDFDRRELGKLREVIWHAQCMGRIGNLVSTWQRELCDRDFSSGVFAHALVQGDLSVDELQQADQEKLAETIQRGQHEAYFFRRWQAHRAAICRMQPLIKSVNVQYLLVALERLIRMELASRGFK